MNRLLSCNVLRQRRDTNHFAVCERGDTPFGPEEVDYSHPQIIHVGNYFCKITQKTLVLGRNTGTISFIVEFAMTA